MSTTSSEGYEEECYFDFTFSPVFLGDGSVGGILAVVNEVTQSILNQRRLSTLNQFSKQAPLIQSVDGAYSMITTILQEANNLDVPFSIVYKTKDTKDASTSSTLQGTYSPKPANQCTGFTSQQQQDFLTTGTAAGTGQDPDGGAISKVKLIRSHFTAGIIANKKEVRRAAQAAILCSTSFDRNLEIVNYGGTKEKIFSKSISTRHIPDSLLITPEEYEPLDPAAPVYDDPWAWPVRSVLADGIPRLVTLPKSTHKLARALLLPILENPSVLDSRITTVLIVGINPYQMLDNQYLDFLALLVANIASLLHFGQSREEERKSAEALFELNKAKISFFQNVSHELRSKDHWWEEHPKTFHTCSVINFFFPLTLLLFSSADIDACAVGRRHQPNARKFTAATQSGNDSTQLEATFEAGQHTFAVLSDRGRKGSCRL